MRASAVWRTVGLVLFLFIPVVLYCFVAQPEPLGWSLAVGLVLMFGHRFLAVPYMQRVAPHMCIWCQRWWHDSARMAVLHLHNVPTPIRTCPHHRSPTARFFALIWKWRRGLQLGIFVPLGILLVSIALAAFGGPDWRSVTTPAFKLIIGGVVNAAALGYLWETVPPAIGASFPMHNFYLIGIRNILWVFRIVGIFWIVQVLMHIGHRI